jgi:RimJ/RimL family protein N-acetyltransferase
MPATGAPTLTTARLLLRGWRAADRVPFAALNADARVTEFLGGPLSRAASDALADRIEAHFAERGFGLWSVELPGEAKFIGFVGLSTPAFAAPFTPCVEIGWRLAAAHWGHGFATEAARAALQFGFEHCKLAEIVSFTTRANRASRAVMERLGMTRDPRGDFDHPALAATDPLRPHVLYRIQAGTFARNRADQRGQVP